MVFFSEFTDNIETAGGRTDHLERAWMLDMLSTEKSVDYFATTWRSSNGDARHKDRFIRMDILIYSALRTWIKVNCSAVDWKVKRHREKAVS